MHRIDWIQNGESFAVSTDGSMDDALALFVNARANLERERAEETRALLGQTADALERLASHLIHTDPE